MPDDDPRRDLGHASRDLAAVNTELERWAGTHAIVFGSGLSHRHFRIDLWQEGRQTQLAVLCALPNYYCGPLKWNDARVQIRPANAADREEYFAEFEVSDVNAGVRLVCQDVQLIEEPTISWRR